MLACIVLLGLLADGGAESLGTGWSDDGRRLLLRFLTTLKSSSARGMVALSKVGKALLGEIVWYHVRIVTVFRCSSIGG